MDRIEPVRPSPPAIAPVDAARVRRLAREKEGTDPRSEQRRRRREAQRNLDEAETEIPSPDHGEDEGRPRIDIRA